MGNYRISGHILWDAGQGASGWRDGEIYVHDGIVSTQARPELIYQEISGWAIPGLVDVHCHVGLAMEGAVDEATAEAQARADLEAGTLLIRDCGVPRDTHWIDQRPDLPKIIRAGSHLARPKRYLRHYGIDVENPADLPALAAEQAQRGDGWVKIVGDWIDRSRGADSDLEPLWETPVLVDAVAAAHENGARVTVHAFGHATIEGLLEAGVDCIEHGTGLDDDQIAEVVSRGIAVTPTVMQIDRFVDFASAAGEKYPVYASTMQAMYEGRLEHMQKLAAAGVHLLPGTDSGGYQEHGTLPVELGRWADLGLSGSQIIDLATWKVRQFLGAEALAEGAPADLVVYAADPRAELSVLASPHAVILRGELRAGALSR